MIPDIDWQTIVALLALAFSVYTFRKTHGISEKQAELIADQKRLNELWVAKEEAEAQSARKADVSANLIKLANGRKVKVFNRGKANARNVRIATHESENGVRISKGDVEGKFPLEVLEPQQGVELIASAHLGSAPKTALTLTWDDETGDNHTKTVYLTL